MRIVASLSHHKLLKSVCLLFDFQEENNETLKPKLPTHFENLGEL